ncbi:Chemotaxis response regulator protein-glutamate methylesterase [Streptococcus pneumoniae]|jgi:two-component system chemotaxis response regulator CheB|uniref:chemotaxis protein CheB n=1 Tax=Stutzerimonas stutzeri TaxID=316 RepID=UPI0005E8DC8B|nr:chemotaxis protein CheB [Stutzerimonas stutzeri]CJK94698.1 Chemotaxis response regulator protein-glutamate methylesterase [Streptococcus pneumoniae]MCP3430278.1 chemotaxis protein CheB [Stutzerimonas stutzeri]MCQ4225867.1 chemotaxis protein CheB [Stutzerimonas stutzeri]RRV79789.1 chemotaxis protein CheB [Stutzerimonas stutzeri]RRV89135.1 chemotaxis protein CheB [Stutzerimonas stutzeri]
MSSEQAILRSKRQPPIEAVVIGASAGGLEALGMLLDDLPANFRLPILVVQHVPANGPTHLAEIFGRRTRLRVKEADDKDAVSSATLYFAAPGYHLLVERDRSLSLSQDDAVHFSRPSIDVLFESAADVWGPQVAGVLLTGANEDGAAGLEAIHRVGGLTVIQDPAEAAVPTMPRAALQRFAPDYILPLRDIHRLLRELE